MHELFAWSLPMGRLFGINVRVHWLFPCVALGYVAHVAFAGLPGDREKYLYPPGAWIDAAILIGILFVSVLLHEFGHCFAARAVDGEASEILIWPLGGLASVDVPNRPRAHFLTAAAGPAVNLLLCAACLLALLAVDSQSIRPNWNPLSGEVFRGGERGEVGLYSWSAGLFADKPDLARSPYALSVWLQRVWWVNWFLALINIVLVGFPLDGGRMLQAALWPSLGFRQATLVAVFAGFAVVFVVCLYAFIVTSVMALCLAYYIYTACRAQWVVLETGGEDGVFGYDFSQGYTSLERDQPQQAAPPRPRVSWWRRWLQRRAARRLQRATEQREAEERRLDELLEKVHRHGRASLTDEEERFMKRVSDRYRKSGGQ